MSATCKSCGAPIEWGKTFAGKSVPLDPPEKRYIKLTDQVHGVAYRIAETWLSHFASCPNSDSHRKKK